MKTERVSFSRRADFAYGRFSWFVLALFQMVGMGNGDNSLFVIIIVNIVSYYYRTRISRGKGQRRSFRIAQSQTHKPQNILHKVIRLSKPLQSLVFKTFLVKLLPPFLTTYQRHRHRTTKQELTIRHDLFSSPAHAIK